MLHFWWDALVKCCRQRRGQHNCKPTMFSDCYRWHCCCCCRCCCLPFHCNLFDFHCIKLDCARLCFWCVAIFDFDLGISICIHFLVVIIVVVVVVVATLCVCARAVSLSILSLLSLSPSVPLAPNELLLEQFIIKSIHQPPNTLQLRSLRSFFVAISVAFQFRFGFFLGFFKGRGGVCVTFTCLSCLCARWRSFHAGKQLQTAHVGALMGHLMSGNLPLPLSLAPLPLLSFSLSLSLALALPTLDSRQIVQINLKFINKDKQEMQHRHSLTLFLALSCNAYLFLLPAPFPWSLAVSHLTPLSLPLLRLHVGQTYKNKKAIATAEAAAAIAAHLGCYCYLRHAYRLHTHSAPPLSPSLWSGCHLICLMHMPHATAVSSHIFVAASWQTAIRRQQQQQQQRDDATGWHRIGPHSGIYIFICIP